MKSPHSSTITNSIHFCRLIHSSVINSKSHVRRLSNAEANYLRFTRLLRKCSRAPYLHTTKALHALAVTLGSDIPQPIFPCNIIMASYLSLGQMPSAHKLFDEMPLRNVVSYNTIIGAYSRDGYVESAWELLSEMRFDGLEPTQFTFGGLLSNACLDLRRGLCLQSLIVKSGLLYSDAFAGTALLGLFGRHGCVDEAIKLFEDMPCKSLVTWNSMMSLFGEHGFAEESVVAFCELMRSGMALSGSSFVGVLSAFVSEFELDLGEQIHGLVIKNGLDFVVSVGNSLINMYAKCSGPYMAEKVFKEVPVVDVVSWNTIISALDKSDRPGRGFELFLYMYDNQALPNQTTFLCLINCSTRLKIPIFGEYIHAKVIKNSFISDVYIGSALVDFYSKHGKLQDAHCLFGEISKKNLIHWNALMLGYTNSGCSTSILLMQEMIRLGYLPNEFSFSNVIKSTTVLELEQLHSLIIKMGYQHNDFVLSSMITSYAKHGLISDALMLVPSTDMSVSVVPCNAIAGIYNRNGEYEKTQELFSVLEEPDIVSWNILLAACSRSGNYKEVFELFEDMQRTQVIPDNYTYVSLFSVCTKLCNLALGSSLHCFLIKTDFNSCDTFVHNVMIDMYGKCGSPQSSVKIFHEMNDRNVVSWTALVSTLGLHGHAYEAIQMFREMVMAGFKPDGVAFMAVLSACRHAGLVKVGMEIFEEMKSKYKVEPAMDHYLLVVDLLARCGYLKDAEQLIAGMPFPPNALIWRCFLLGCKRQRTIQNQALHLNINQTTELI